MNIPEDVSFILEKLVKKGFESYVVGGCVRDSIKGKIPKDWDIATSASPDEVKSLFDKTYDTGLKHGTVTVAVNERRCEVTTFRIDGEYKDSRRPENVIYSDKIEDDLKRRDFTINAVAWNAAKGYVDPFDGIKDIGGKLIRGVGNPGERFREDALRMLRAVRFAACLGFEIENETSNAIIENAGLIENISSERIREEILELLRAPSCEIVLGKEFISLMEHISPPLAFSLENDKEKLMGLLEDCKKSDALLFASLIFYLNDADADSILKKLKFSNKLYTRIYSLHKIQNESVGEEYTDVVKKVSQWGMQTFEDYLYIQMLNCIANNTNLEYVLRIEDNFRLINENNYPVFVEDLAINGYDLSMEFNIAGKVIGKTLKNLLEYVHNNPEKNTYDILIKVAYSLITKS